MKTLDYFLQAARSQSFSQAAKNCRISQTAMSLAISKLEGEIGFTLFDRERRPMVLTPEGREFYAWAAEMVDGLASITSAKSDSEKGPALAIAAASSYDALAFNSYVQAFKKENSAVTIMMRVVPHGKMQGKPPFEEADGFFGPSRLLEGAPKAKAIEIASCPMMVAVSSSHELAALSRVSPATLRGYTCAVMAYACTGRLSDAFARQIEGEAVKFKRMLYMEHVEEVLLYAANNGAVALVPSLAARFIPQGFAILPVEGWSMNVPYSFFALEDNEKPELAAFLHFLERGEGKLA